MSAPTFNQSRRILGFFDEVEATNEQLQNWLGAGDLQKLMLKADLSKVDREAFRALLYPPPAPTRIEWGRAINYVRKIRDWNQRFQLGLSNRQIERLLLALPDHAGPLQPTGISLTLGHGLTHDWEVAMAILEYEIEKLGVRFTSSVDVSRVSYDRGSEPVKSTGPQLAPALLDIGTFWDPQNGIMLRKVCAQRLRWPGLEVAWLLALNPQVFLAMDGKTIPFLGVIGLVIGFRGAPNFYSDSNGAFVCEDSFDSWWTNASAVAFRK